MSRICALVLVAFFLPLCASAQLSTTPNYTEFDQAQFAKLRALVGTWRCVGTPASKKPDLQTTTRNGNYFVTRETGDTPNTSYTRWSHPFHMFYTVELDDSGPTRVTMTKALDPVHATWDTSFPSRDPSGRAYFPIRIELNGSTMTYAGKYFDENGKIATFRNVCTKAS